jgi:argininosuccinate synthase
VKLSRGHCSIVGRKSEHSLYSLGLATYDSGDQFDHNAALGFIKLWALPLSTQAQAQLLPSIGIEGNLLNSSGTKVQIAEKSESQS